MTTTKHADIFTKIAERDAAPVTKKPRRVKRWQILGVRDSRKRVYDIRTARRIAARYNRLYGRPGCAYLSSLSVWV